MKTERMFDTLSDNLGSIFDRLRGRGALSEKDVDAALGDIRTALLEADVASARGARFPRQSAP